MATKNLLRINAAQNVLCRDASVSGLLSKCEYMPDGTLDPNATVATIFEIFQRNHDVNIYWNIRGHLESILYSMADIPLLWWMSNHKEVEQMVMVALCFERSFFIGPLGDEPNPTTPQQLSAYIVTLFDLIATMRRTDACAGLKLQHEEMFKTNPTLNVFLTGPAAATTSD